MNRSQLIDRIIEDTNYSRVEIEEIVKATLNGISVALQEGKKVSLSGFGTFEVTTRPPRSAINPRTLEKVKVGKRSRVKFKAGKELVEMVNEEGF